MDEHAFRIVASSVLERRKLAFDYRARSTDEKTRRNVSPQRLTHYRDNWYLDAWDHDRDALRSFAVDRIHKARVVDSTARDVADSELLIHDAHLDDPTTAFALSRLTDAGVLHQSPIGIFRQVERATYDDQARSQLATASVGHDDPHAALASLISGGDTWTVV